MVYEKHQLLTNIINPYFLSIELMLRFLESLQPLHHALGPLMFQFEYLNKQKMSGATAFIDRFGRFVEQLPKGFLYCVESRNPNYLNATYFNFLKSLNLRHVFLQGYYMPSIFDVYREQIEQQTVIRLHGPDRKGIEKPVGDDWSRIVAPKDQDIRLLVRMLKDLQSRKVQTFVLVNNQFEGSAPQDHCQDR